MLAMLVLTGCNRPAEPFETRPKQSNGALQRYWLLPSFSLTERSGETVTLESLRGKVWVADFFYTTCPGPCPMLTSRLSEVHAATRVLEDVRLVSISTDPQKDTPEILKQYAARFGADEKWLFLTGEKSSVFELANSGFRLSVSEDRSNAAEPITHSTKLVLVDRNGAIRGFYEGTTPDSAKKLVIDIAQLLKETR